MNESAGKCSDPRLIFETDRLQVFVAGVDHVDLFFELWTDPRVMGNVGFPQGLSVTREEIVLQLQGQEGHIFDSRLVVLLRDTDNTIGECKLGWPNLEGIATTDVKLLPEYWGNKYGVEIKRALLDYLFRHTSCVAVEATPNVENIASIKMQESVGGVRMGESTFQVPESMQNIMIPVHHYIYRVFREEWTAT